MIKILIVEDNPVYEALLKNKLVETGVSLKVIGTTHTIPLALDLIAAEKPDVLILDVDLGTSTSFELFEKINYKDFEIIFATAFNDFAISAFDVEAIGYLVKPVITSQLKKFLLVAESNLLEKTLSQEIVNKQSKSQKHTISGETISVASDTGFDVVPISKIERCEAINSTTHIFLSDGSKLVSSYNLGKFSDLLSTKGFYPVHRSHLVNLSYVKKYLRSGIIIMQDGTEIPCSKANRQDFISIFSAAD